MFQKHLNLQYPREVFCDDDNRGNCDTKPRRTSLSEIVIASSFCIETKTGFLVRGERLQFPSTTPAAHMPNSTGLLLQYLSLSSTCITVAWHHDRVYFDLSFCSKYKLANLFNTYFTSVYPTAMWLQCNRLITGAEGSYKASDG